MLILLFLHSYRVYIHRGRWQLTQGSEDSKTEQNMQTVKTDLERSTRMKDLLFQFALNRTFELGERHTGLSNGLKLVSRLRPLNKDATLS